MERILAVLLFAINIHASLYISNSKNYQVSYSSAYTTVSQTSSLLLIYRDFGHFDVSARFFTIDRFSGQNSTYMADLMRDELSKNSTQHVYSRTTFYDKGKTWIREEYFRYNLQTNLFEYGFFYVANSYDTFYIMDIINFYGDENAFFTQVISLFNGFNFINSTAITPTSSSSWGSIKQSFK